MITVHLFGMNNMRELYLRVCHVAGIEPDSTVGDSLLRAPQTEALRVIESLYPVRIVGEFPAPDHSTLPDIIEGKTVNATFASTAQPDCRVRFRGLTWDWGSARMFYNLIGSGLWTVEDINVADVPAVR